LTVDQLADKYKITSEEKLVAYNLSYWQWEYDHSETHAFLFLNPTGELRLNIIDEHIKSGIGAGTRFTNQVDENVGTLIKPLFAKIRTLLKQNSHQKTRAGYPFPRQWENPTQNYQKEDLTSILKEYQNV
jgi:hypothetical protein